MLPPAFIGIAGVCHESAELSYGNGVTRHPVRIRNFHQFTARVSASFRLAAPHPEGAGRNFDKSAAAVDFAIVLTGQIQAFRVKARIMQVAQYLTSLLALQRP